MYLHKKLLFRWLNNNVKVFRYSQADERSIYGMLSHVSKPTKKVVSWLGWICDVFCILQQPAKTYSAGLWDQVSRGMTLKYCVGILYN